jgi:ATP-dependent Clp protease ATP-binding subunit ClpX
LPVITGLSKLSENDLVRILVEPENCMMRQYQKLLGMEGLDLSFTSSALREVASMAVGQGTGARGLRSIVERIMLEVMFEAPRLNRSGEIRVTKAMVRQRNVSAGKISRRLKKAS